MGLTSATSEKKNGGFEDIVVETIQNETLKKKGLKK